MEWQNLRVIIGVHSTILKFENLMERGEHIRGILLPRPHQMQVLLEVTELKSKDGLFGHTTIIDSLLLHLLIVIYFFDWKIFHKI